MPPDNLLDLFRLDAAAALPGGGNRHEPIAAAPAEAVTVGFEDDPEPEPPPAALASDRPPGPSPEPRRPLGLVGAAAVHLLPLVFLLHWHWTAVEAPPPIPVQLVLEAPPSPPPASPRKVPPGRLASEDIGDPNAPPERTDPTAEPSPPPKPTAPATPRLAAAPSRAEPIAQLPPPAPITTRLAEIAPPRPEPAPAPRESEKQLATARLPARPPPPHGVRGIGPYANRDEYLAYCNALIRSHVGLLPMSFIAGREGTTIVHILIRGNGTIAQISVVRSSGYPDIDTRVEQMVAAVHRFPPVPQWFQGSLLPVDLILPFPAYLSQH